MPSNSPFSSGLIAGEAQFEALFEKAPDAIIVVGEDGRLIAANAAAETLFGYSRPELLELSVETLMPDRFREHHAHTRSAYMNSPRARPMKTGLELWGKGKDGKEIPLDIMLNPVRINDRHVVIATMRDMTMHRQMTAALIQSEKLAAIGQFAAGVVHDLNNPIGVILGFSQATLPSLQESDPVRNTLKTIEQEALRCKNLVRNLLSFSRNQKSELALQLQDLKDVVEAAMTLVGTMAHQRDVELDRQYEAELPPLMLDQAQIQQVVINLCVNAMDAMPTGGQLTVAIAKAGEEVCLSVGDTGTGIPPEIRQHIFDAFFTTKVEGKGTGLGLSLVSDIVKNHKGRIELDSEMGKGTTFKIYLKI